MGRKPDVAPVPPVASETLSTAASVPPLPERGRILSRVDRGDSNFEIGRARQEWEIADGHYHLRSVIETTGLFGSWEYVWSDRAFAGGRALAQALREPRP